MRVQYPEAVHKKLEAARPYVDPLTRELKPNTPEKIRKDREWALKEMERIDKEWEEIFYGEAVTEYHE